MRSVTVRMPAADLARAMVVMREFLISTNVNQRGSTAVTKGAEVVLSVDFSTGAAADGFARRFGAETRSLTSG